MAPGVETIIQPPQEGIPARTDSLGEVVLQGIHWSTFEAILQDLGDHRGSRVAYDRGRLEFFMSPTSRHDWWKRLIGRMVEMLTFELRVPIKSGSSSTLKRGDLARAAEPDECYWIGHEPRVRGKDVLDLASDPPPDLAIEIDITHSSIPRLGIYAAMGVRGVWRVEEGAIWFYHLQPDGTCATGPASRALPGLNAADLRRFLEMSQAMDETSWMYAFRDWVRDELIPRARGGVERAE